MFKRVGKAPSGERLEKIRKQLNYRDGKFHNVEPTSINPDNVPFHVILKAMFSRPATVTPSKELPHKKANLSALSNDNLTVVWFGHSSYLINYKGFKILVDPVFSGNASPVKFFGKPFAGTDLYKPEDFPEIDLLLLTHDHYDHLDYSFIKQFHPKVKKVVTSLGVGEHLELWGVERSKIVELAWTEKHQIKELTVKAMPSRHFSGRSFAKFNTLWSSFILQWPHQKVYVGGDSGYSSEYKRIGNEEGPFDIVFLECGQYSKYWPQIHMMPEETVKAAKDLKAKTLIPVHWGKFVLSIHPWNESIIRLANAAKKENQHFVAPMLGEAWEKDEEYFQKDWWNFEHKLK